MYIAMPPLFRIDIGKDVYYALDEAEKEGILDRISAENKKGRWIDLYKRQCSRKLQ